MARAKWNKPLSDGLIAKARAHELVDGLLAELRRAQMVLRGIAEQEERELKAVNQRYESDLSVARDRVQQLEKDLMARLKADREMVFADGDRLELSNGAVVHQGSEHVVIPKDALDRIKENGWAGEAVRQVEEVRRDVVEKWTDERLKAVGASRHERHKYEYEVMVGIEVGQ